MVDLYFRDGKLQVESVDPLETWKAMEELVEEGYVKAIGKRKMKKKEN